MKRFVNIYRLIKTRVGDAVEFAHATRPDADFRIVLYLLAESTGRPESAVSSLSPRSVGLADDVR